MANPVDSIGADDGILTAYLDGELAAGERAALDRRLVAEPALQARLEELRRGERAFRPAYEALLSVAPAERLQAMFTGLAAGNAEAGRRPSRGGSRRLAAIAAAVVLFLAGGLVGYLVPTLRPVEPPGWRQVVAEYQTLTTAETLAAIPDDPAMLLEELTVLGSKLALSLAPDKLALPDVVLKRAQMFDFRGRPLVQLAYLSPADGPIAFCIIQNGRPDADLAFEQREGSNIVFWTRDGRGYMLIGKTPREALEAYAGDLAARFS